VDVDPGATTDEMIASLVSARSVRVFRHDFALEDAIGSHACSLKLTIAIINYAETRKVRPQPVPCD
jgi:hypothetical protein